MIQYNVLYSSSEHTTNQQAIFNVLHIMNITNNLPNINYKISQLLCLNKFMKSTKPSNNYKYTFGRKVGLAFSFMRPINYQWTKTTKSHRYLIWQQQNELTTIHQPYFNTRKLQYGSKSIKLLITYFVQVTFSEQYIFCTNIIIIITIIIIIFIAQETAIQWQQKQKVWAGTQG